MNFALPEMRAACLFIGILGAVIGSLVERATAQVTLPDGPNRDLIERKCETCHTSTTAFVPATMNHTGISTGCASCHGGNFATIKTKPATHIVTSAACETCHKSTTSFKGGAAMNHTGISTGCASCHNGTTALGKPAAPNHIPTSISW